MGIHNCISILGLYRTTLMVLGMLVAMAPTRVLHAEPTSQNVVTFLGFSANETITAWRVQVNQPNARGGRDKYTLIQIIDANTNALKVTFRGSSGISRSGGGDGASALHDNPKFAQSLPYGEWQRFSRKAHWWKKRVPMNDPQIRLLTDRDMRAELKADTTSIHVKGQPGSPIGYQPVAYLVDGQMVSLGHFRKEARDNLPMRARVEVYRSHSAFHVAVLHHFEVPTNAGKNSYRPEPMGIVVKLDEMLGHSSVGTMNLMRANLRVGEKIFQAENPDSADLYHNLVGTYW